jgi:hypothetical protein
MSFCSLSPDDHCFDAHAGLEFDFIDGVQVGRIRDAENRRLPRHTAAGMLE